MYMHILICKEISHFKESVFEVSLVWQNRGTESIILYWHDVYKIYYIWKFHNIFDTYKAKSIIIQRIFSENKFWGILYNIQLFCFIIFASLSLLNMANSLRNWALGFMTVCLSPRHLGQYHFPFGLLESWTQLKWNHSIGQRSLSQPIISPYETLKNNLKIREFIISSQSKEFRLWTGFERISRCRTKFA